MKKSKKYPYTFFHVEVIKNAMDVLGKISNTENIQPSTLRITLDNEEWDHDNIAEFFTDYIKNPIWVTFNIYHEENGFRIEYQSYLDKRTEISVNGNNRKEIEEIFNVFDSSCEKCIVPKDEENLPIIFIGHGRKNDWSDLANHLTYKHGYKIQAYESGARAGNTIRDILESMLDISSFAILVLTGEDFMANNGIRARQNVIHEAGLFQGRLGFNRAIMIVEEGIENFSNVDGIQQIRYNPGNIKETFGEILATIKREFGK